jgi:hypothetical protein
VLGCANADACETRHDLHDQFPGVEPFYSFQ